MKKIKTCDQKTYRRKATKLYGGDVRMDTDGKLSLVNDIGGTDVRNVTDG